MIYKIFYKIIEKLVDMDWKSAFTIAIFHAISSYLILLLLQEKILTENILRFIYFYIITGSTVGYGDFSPETRYGSMFVAIWVVPGAIALFAYVLAKFISTINETIGKIMMGLGDFTKKSNHIIIIGYIKNSTEKLISEIKHDFPNSEIIIVNTEKVIHNKMDNIKTVIVESLSNINELRRSGIEQSSHTIVMIDDDDKTISCCLAVSSLSQKAKIIAHFQKEESIQLIENSCPNVICIVSNEIEKMSRALTDPETSQLVSFLFSNQKHSANVRSTNINLKGIDSIKAKELIDYMLKTYNANIIAFKKENTQETFFINDGEQIIDNNSKVYYISRKKLDKIILIDA